MPIEKPPSERFFNRAGEQTNRRAGEIGRAAKSAKAQSNGVAAHLVSRSPDIPKALMFENLQDFQKPVDLPGETIGFTSRKTENAWQAYPRHAP